MNWLEKRLFMKEKWVDLVVKSKINLNKKIKKKL
jgi:hypothetical protein